MASCSSNPDEIDRLSALPDEVLITILSLLPNCTASRTSVLSRRFRHLWKNSPSVDLTIKFFNYFRRKTFVAMATSAILSRTSSNPLPRLHLEIGNPLQCNTTDSFISSLLLHAHSLRLRHLIIDGLCFFESILHAVFSISTLESLSILIIPEMTFPSTIAFTRLKSLSINLTKLNSTQFQGLLSQLCCLEDLQLYVSAGIVCLSSRTIKRLELLLFDTSPEPYSLGLSMPSLEFLSFKNFEAHENLPHIHGDIPFIRKAVVTLESLHQKHIPAIAQFLNCISHVEELSLDLEEHMLGDYPFHVLMEPGKEVPTFPNLKHLDVNICFHESNFEAVVTMLHHCPVLESLKLHHKSSDMCGVKRGKRNAWRSKLPRNSDDLPLAGIFEVFL
ncbi:FBD-associated F-box protein [Carex littledalei]|uniref:FBD-associated F-box protein n=1 Tax=Carex littledalei TaxID=544730 RepID=A0A833QIU6_9POAL|nr:FBD-associated F-box protein [Carex littledalei]